MRRGPLRQSSGSAPLNLEHIPEDIQEMLRILEDAARKEDEKASRVRLPNGQLSRLSFELDENYGHRSAKLSLETPRVEQAIVAALTALHGRKVDPKRVRRSIYAAEWSHEALRSLVTGEPRPEPKDALLLSLWIGSYGDQQRGSRVGVHAPQRGEGRYSLRHQPSDLFVQFHDLFGEPPVATSNGPPKGENRLRL